MIMILIIQVCAVTDDVDKKISERRSIHSRTATKLIWLWLRGYANAAEKRHARDN